jgi:2-polyprenyl-6-methoxyphenol hydroxylase-like FAD-dependent oxidoreductase
MTETVVVLGAGMAGLCTALALAPTGRRIVLLERDPAPPADGLEDVFDGWERRGASQLRHSHAFLARLRSLIGREHPALLTALRAAGARELRFADALPPAIAKTYVPDPADEDMAVLVSRRSTLEAVIRRHVEADERVQIRSGVFVEGLITEREPGGALIARGFKVADGEPVLGDLVIDAGGRASPMIDWLAQAGAAIDDEAEDCAILYYTRFYRLHPGRADPPRGAGSPTGDLGYLKFGVFPADNGTFSITLAVPEVEERLRAAVVRGESFEAICASLPGVAPWTDPARSTPVSRVHAMGDLKSRWREFAPRGRPAILAAFSVGDSLVRTNPLFGRGCSFAAIEAHLLRDVLVETTDPAERARLYSARVRAELHPFFKDMREQDRAAARRARRILEPPRRRKLAARLMRRFIEDGVSIAIRQDIGLLRDAMRAFHMLEPPRRWLGRPANLAKILRVMARGRKANAHLYPAPAGPPRSQLLPALGLSLTARLGEA